MDFQKYFLRQILNRRKSGLAAPARDAHERAKGARAAPAANATAANVAQNLRDHVSLAILICRR